MRIVEVKLMHTDISSKEFTAQVTGGMPYFIQRDGLKVRGAKVHLGYKGYIIVNGVYGKKASQYVKIESLLSLLYQEYKVWRSPALGDFFDTYMMEEGTKLKHLVSSRLYHVGVKKEAGKPLLFIEPNEDDQSILIKLKTGIKQGYAFPVVKSDGVEVLASQKKEAYNSLGQDLLLQLSPGAQYVLPMVLFGSARSDDYSAIVITYDGTYIKIVGKDIVGNNKELTADDLDFADVFNVDDIINTAVDHEQYIFDEIQALSHTQEKEVRQASYDKAIQAHNKA